MRQVHQGLLALLVVTVVGPTLVRAQEATTSPEAASRIEHALGVQAALQASPLRVLGDAFACPDARYVAYRRSSLEPEYADQWYVVSQLWADAVLLRLAASPTAAGVLPPGWDAPDTRCHTDKALIFLDRLWDYQRGGYAPRADPTGGQVDRGARYVDDNSLGGLAFLARLETATDPLQRRQLLHAARREAAFLLESGTWDETFGGGFWWNTDRGTTLEGKPAQTNALAALFLARLYLATGDDVYREWTLRTLLWMDTILFDPMHQLYRWSVHYADPERRSGAVLSDRYFNYDQGIAVEAQLAAALLDADPSRVARAQALGRTMHPAFWNAVAGGYNLEAGPEQVYASYAAWASLGHLALYDLDGDPAWLDLARLNADALAATLRQPDGGYAYRLNSCPNPAFPDCEDPARRYVVDTTRDTSAQAWVQHLQVELARRLLPVEDVGPTTVEPGEPDEAGGRPGAAPSGLGRVIRSAREPQ